MHVSALDHIVLNVADVDTSLDFYQRALGLCPERVDEWRSGDAAFPSLRISDTTLIDLVHDAAPVHQSRPNLAHFSLVTDDTELTELIANLARAGTPLEAGPVIRSGARGNGLSIYVRDPDQNLLEVRTYASRPLVRATVEEARAHVHAAIDAMQHPEAAVVGNEAWSQKDLIAHLTSIEGWWRKQIEIAVYARPWDFEPVHDFNTRAVAERREWSLHQLTQELDQEAAALQALLETLDESDLDRIVQHPNRVPRRLADGWMMIRSHADRHLAELS
jgi:catechol 2,3-dioxygenase-like lactoylglutathione lyase family enzyme